MPDYKKKRKHYRPIKKKKFADYSPDIELKPQKDRRKAKRESVNEIAPPKLIKGKKQKRIARAQVIGSTFAIIVIIVVILKIIFPVGIIEMSNHFFKTLGVGNFPIELVGNEVVDVSAESDHYYVLTNTELYSLTNNGKLINNFSHKLSNPVVCSSATRALIFDQGKNEFDVYVNGEKKYSGTTESGIICGDISDSGVYAVASYSKSYTSTVSVYSSKGVSIYKWNCAGDYINSIALSKNGKQIAVSTINTSGGKIYSKIYIFNFNNTNSEKIIAIDGEAVYNLVSNDKGFFMVQRKSVVFVNWNDFSEVKTNNDYNLKIFKTNSNNSIAVFSRQDNENDNYLCLFDRQGTCIKKFRISAKIKDVSIKNKRVFILGENSSMLFNFESEKIGEVACSDLGRKIIAVDSTSFCLVEDEIVSSYQFK